MHIIIRKGIAYMAKGRVEIYADACKSCRYCINTCPNKVLGITDAVNINGYQYVSAVNKDACTGCGMCARICPDAAISVYREA